MPAITTNLTIADGAATPVVRVFNPERISPELSVFVDRSAEIPAGFPRLTVRFSAANGKRPTTRIDIDFDLPVTVPVDGALAVQHIGRFKGYFVIPDTMTAANRAHLHKLVVNSINHSTVREVVQDLSPMF